MKGAGSIRTARKLFDGGGCLLRRNNPPFPHANQRAAEASSAGTWPFGSVCVQSDLAAVRAIASGR